jgi:hypothetical protein
MIHQILTFFFNHSQIFEMLEIFINLHHTRMLVDFTMQQPRFVIQIQKVIASNNRFEVVHFGRLRQYFF